MTSLAQMKLGRRWVHGLAKIEEKARIRLHQAANRMEDADAIEVGVALRAVKVLNGIDRITGFRAAHKADRQVPDGERTPPAEFGPTPRPELGGLDPDALDTKTRARLRQTWRVWQRELADRPGTPECVAAEAAWKSIIADSRQF